MKTGTSWLYDKLRDHPDIHFSREKELHYFAHHYLKEKPLGLERRKRHAAKKIARLAQDGLETDDFQQGLRWYLDYVAGPVNDVWFAQLLDAKNNSDRYIADFSNLTCFLKAEAWQSLAGRTGTLKVIYIVRDPVERLWSHFKFQLRNQGHSLAREPASDFELFRQVTREEPFIRNSRYSRVIETLNQVLPPDSFMLCYFEQMVADPLQYLRSIEQHLGIAAFEYDRMTLGISRNSSIDVAMPGVWRDHAIEILQPEIESLRQAGIWSDQWGDY